MIKIRGVSDMSRTERPEAEVKPYLVAKENEELKAELAAAETAIKRHEELTCKMADVICDMQPKLAAAERERDAERANNARLRETLERVVDVIDDQIGEGGYIPEFDLVIDANYEPWESIFDMRNKADDLLKQTPSDSAERVRGLVELLQDAVSETENGEKLSVGFCLAARDALEKWRVLVFNTK